MPQQQGIIAIDLYGTVYHHKTNSESKEKRMAPRIEDIGKNSPQIS